MINEEQPVEAGRGGLKSSTKFAQALEKARQSLEPQLTQSGPPSSDLFGTISAMQQRMIASGGGSVGDLLQLQMYANTFNVRIELLSKVAESGNGALRRLQNNQ